MDPNPLAIHDPTVVRDGSCLNHSQSISDFLSKNSHNKQRTADKTRFHDTAV